MCSTRLVENEHSHPDGVKDLEGILWCWDAGGFGYDIKCGPGVFQRCRNEKMPWSGGLSLGPMDVVEMVQEGQV